MASHDAPPTAGTRLDRLASIVSSEAFAVGFLWWAVLVALAPACLVCSLGLHASGAVEAALVVALVGVGVAAASILRLAGIAVSVRRRAAT